MELKSPETIYKVGNHFTYLACLSTLGLSSPLEGKPYGGQGLECPFVTIPLAPGPVSGKNHGIILLHLTSYLGSI